jgi:hypothetical protein
MEESMEPNHRTTAIGQSNISRDEMNLAEFPLAILSKRCGTNIKTLEFTDSVIGRNGEKVPRIWIITGADKFGLPTSSDDEVLLGLLKLTVDTGMISRKIFFTRYELLRVLKWSTEGRSYTRLQKAFDRLSGVRIKATNAFYDNETKSYSTKNFGIIDEYEITNQREVQTKPSFFVWSDVLFQSFKVGFIKKLDLDFYLDLKSAISKRLYRYLDKHFWYKSRISINLFTLCHEKIGISRNYKYSSSLAQQLDPAIEELTARGFISGCQYLGKGSQTTVTFITTSGLARINQSSQSSTNTSQINKPKIEIHPEMDTLINQLVARGLSETHAKRLSAKVGISLLTKAFKIIQYYDSLREQGSGLVNQNPVGFLFRAIERIDSFVLPKNFVKCPPPKDLNVVKATCLNVEQATKPISELNLKGNERRKRLKSIKTTLTPEQLKSISNDVENALSKLKGLISERRYEEAVLHGVEEKLLKLFS